MFYPKIYFFFIYFYWLEANYFTILWWFLPYIDLNQPCIYMCSPSWTPVPSPSPSHPSGSSQRLCVLRQMPWLSTGDKLSIQLLKDKGLADLKTKWLSSPCGCQYGCCGSHGEEEGRGVLKSPTEHWLWSHRCWGLAWAWHGPFYRLHCMPLGGTVISQGGSPNSFPKK